jgi:hypothetical protein
MPAPLAAAAPAPRPQPIPPADQVPRAFDQSLPHAEPWPAAVDAARPGSGDHPPGSGWTLELLGHRRPDVIPGLMRQPSVGDQPAAATSDAESRRRCIRVERQPSPPRPRASTSPATVSSGTRPFPASRPPLISSCPCPCPCPVQVIRRGSRQAYPAPPAATPTRGRPASDHHAKRARSSTPASSAHQITSPFFSDPWLSSKNLISYVHIKIN